MSESQDDSHEAILFHNIDADVDPFQMELEKQIEKLPDTLRFIKEYIYFEYLPYLENVIDDLEEIKKTPNFDENLLKVRPFTNKISNEIISCVDLMNNHNIKHSNITKMLYGTLKGNIVVYDLETDKALSTVNVSKTKRIEHIATSTTRFFDTYHTKIAVNCRGESIVQIYSYNHSFSGFHSDCIINIAEANGFNVGDKLTLNCVVSGIKFSKDGYFLSISDFGSGVSIFNIVSNMSIPQQKSEVTEEDKNQVPNEPEKDVDDKSKCILIGRFTLIKKDNYTILNKNTQIIEDKTNKKAAQPTKNEKDKDKKKGKGKEKEESENIINPEEYNIKSEYDEEKGDISKYQVVGENYPMIHFVQKKFIFEDNMDGEYSTCTITVGIYIAFCNSSYFKYIPLNDYITEKMKSVFKVKKVRNNVSLTIEESMNLNSQMMKKEKEFIDYIRKKVDPKNIQNSQSNENISESEGTLKKRESVTVTKDNKDNKDNKDKNKKIDKNTNKKGNTEENNVPIGNINEILKSTTNNEMDFETCFDISVMKGQTKVNKINNLMGIGMIDGTILIWDCELHTEKFLFQKRARFEITDISIDENNLLCGTKIGQIYIYELIEGKEIFTCFHNSFDLYPIIRVEPIFPYMVLTIDSSNKYCLFNTKNKERCAKMLFNTDFSLTKNNTMIGYTDHILFDYNEKYIVCITEKIYDKNIIKSEYENVKENDKEIEAKHSEESIIDLINFYHERIKILKVKEKNESTNFFNLLINNRNMNLVPIEKPPVTQIIEENVKKEDDKKHQKKEKEKKTKNNKEKDKEKEEQEEPVIELPTKLVVNNNNMTIFKIKDILYKCYPDLLYSTKNGLTIKDMMKKSDDEKNKSPDGSPFKIGQNMERRFQRKLSEKSLNVRENLLAGFTDKNGKKYVPVEKKSDTTRTKEAKENISTQQKNIYYNSYMNIKKRYQHKEERIEMINKHKKEIIKELTGKKKKTNNNKHN